MKIVIAGGQTGGPVAPLIAVTEEIKKAKPHTQVFIIDTPTSSGRLLAKEYKYHFHPLRTGKLRRYLSWQNILTPFSVGWGFARALYLLKKIKPDLVLGAGGFIQVPVAAAAKILGVPVIIHQQDVLPSLSNRLAAPFAKKITTTFESSLRHFNSGAGFFGTYSRRKKDQFVVWTGNPFRESMREANKAEAKKFFHLNDELPVILVTGGGSGAEGINRLIIKALPKLTKSVQIIHHTGPGKKKEVKHPHYHAYEFISRMDLAYAASDIVIARAGVSTLTELCNLEKVGIVIPMPGTHQEFNAEVLYDLRAAIPLDQTITTPDKLVSVVRNLLLDSDTQKMLKANVSQLMPKHAAAKIAKIALELTGQES